MCKYTQETLTLAKELEEMIEKFKDMDKEIARLQEDFKVKKSKLIESYQILQEELTNFQQRVLNAKTDTEIFSLNEEVKTLFDFGQINELKEILQKIN